MRSCEVCGRTFQPYRKDQVTCPRSVRNCYKQLPRVRERENDARKAPEYREHRNAMRRGGSPRQQATVREYNRKRQLERSGWTVEEYDEAHERQDGLCAICGRPASGAQKAGSRLHADHDHETGARRQLICGPCNVALGLLGDDPALLRAAADYIERHRILEVTS